MTTDHLTSTALAARAVFWDDYVGQEDTIRRLQVRIRAALAGDRCLPHVLLTGPPGCGKTTLANMIAMELGSSFKAYANPVTVEMLAQVLLTHQDEKLTLFFDEIHLWTTKQQEGILTLLEEGFVDDGGERVAHDKVTVIAGTTRRDRVTPALLDRFPIKPVFQRYSQEEMGKIVAGMAARVGVPIDFDTCVELGKATAGTPRHARGLVEAALDLKDLGDFTVSDVLDLAGVSRDGLNDEHLAYLRILADSQKGKLGLDPIAARMNMRRNLVEEGVEPLLVHLGYVEQEVGGRAITDAGRERLAEGMAY